MGSKSKIKPVIENSHLGDSITDELILEVWKQAWEETDGIFPFTKEIDAKLADLKISTHILETRLANLAKKKEEILTEGERALVAFYLRIRAVSRMVLLGRMATHPPGQIHIARTIYGLEPNQKHEIKETRKLSDALKDGSGTV